MRRGWRVFCTSSIRPRHLALNSEMEISFIDSDLSDDLYSNHSHLLSQLPLDRSCAVDADRDAVDKARTTSGVLRGLDVNTSRMAKMINGWLDARAGFAPAFRGYEPLVLSYATTAPQITHCKKKWSG